MNQFMSEGHLVDLRCKPPELITHFFDFPILGSFETTVRNEMSDLFQFARIKPDPMRSTLIDDNP